MQFSYRSDPIGYVKLESFGYKQPLNMEGMSKFTGICLLYTIDLHGILQKVTPSVHEPSLKVAIIVLQILYPKITLSLAYKLNNNLQ